MKAITSLVALALAAALSLPATADESASARRKARRAEHVERRAHHRSSTVAPNGTCQRDNGRPLDSLNLNHECDREEFWDRIRDRGNDRS